MGFELRQQFLAQANRAELLARVCVTESRKLFAKESIIEPCIVGHEDSSFGPQYDLLGNFAKEWGIGNHFVGNAGEAGNKCRNAAFGIDQGLVLVNHLFTVMKDYGDFCNFVALD